MAERKNMKKIYVVYHGWAFSKRVAEFKSLKKAIAFIESQDYPEEWCFEIEKH